MNKIVLSVVASLAIGGAVVFAVQQGGGRGAAQEGAANFDDLAGQLDAVRAEISAARTEIQGLAEQIRALPRSVSTPIVVPASAKTATGKGAPATTQAADLKNMVAAVLTAEREQRDAERETERAEMRKRFEERRAQIEEFRKGPYDRMNLKINSLASVLEMDEGQKQAYFDLVTKYQKDYEERRNKLREERRAREAQQQGETSSEDARRRRRGGDRGEEYRELYETIHKEFNAGVQQILSATQYETYTGLSRDAQSFRSDDMVTASGEDQRFRGFRGNFGGRGRGGGGRRGR